MKFNSCSICNKLVFGSTCSCGHKCEALVLDLQTTKKEKDLKQEVLTEEESWIGPLDQQCIRCKKKTLYFNIKPPITADEPPLVTTRCKSCNRKTVTYKN